MVPYPKACKKPLWIHSPNHSMQKNLFTLLPMNLNSKHPKSLQDRVKRICSTISLPPILDSTIFATVNVINSLLLRTNALCCWVSCQELRCSHQAIERCQLFRNTAVLSASPVDPACFEGFAIVSAWPWWTSNWEWHAEPICSYTIDCI